MLILFNTVPLGPGFACGEDDDWTMHHETAILDSGGAMSSWYRDFARRDKVLGSWGSRITRTMWCVAACSNRRARERERDRDRW